MNAIERVAVKKLQQTRLKEIRRGKDTEKSICERFYQCNSCKKVMERRKRKPKPEDYRCGEWKCHNCFQNQFGNHLRYQRRQIRDSDRKEPRKYFFYDFETTQNELMTCTDGYLARGPCDKQCTTHARCNTCTSKTRQRPCGAKVCKDDAMCDKCRLCKNCDQSWCGLEEHKVTFAVLQSSCKKCENEEMTEHSKCDVCGSRCDERRVVKKNVKVLPCLDHCDLDNGSLGGTMCLHNFVLTS